MREIYGSTASDNPGLCLIASAPLQAFAGPTATGAVQQAENVLSVSSKPRALVLVAIGLVIVGFARTGHAQALAVQETVDVNGNKLTTDSYDSSDPSKSTNRLYDPAKYTGDKGEVIVGPLGAPLGLVNSLAMFGGTAKIYGHAHTGPGTQAAVLQIGSQGYCGAHVDEISVGAGNVDPGWWLQDANFSFPMTDLPNTAGYFTPTNGDMALPTVTMVTNQTGFAGYTNIVGPVYTAVFTSGLRVGQTYYYALLSSYPSSPVHYDQIIWGGTSNVVGSVGNVLVLGNNAIVVVTNGLRGDETFTVYSDAWRTNGAVPLVPESSVTIYAGGTSCSVSGKNVFNQPGVPGDFIIFCASSVTSVSFYGTDRFEGILVAPNAHLKMNGSGTNVWHFSGCLMAKSVTMNGSFNLHFDESLRPAGLCLPEITGQPQGLSLTAGQDAAFTVSADGGASYQWQLNGTNLPDATNATLTLSNVHSGDIGSYSVVVANAFGSVTSVAALLTLQPPVITSQPQSLAVVVGGSATFSVAADGQSPLRYQWRASGVDLPGQTNASLTITNAQLSDFADYTVLVEDANGSVLSAPATLAPAAVPSIASFGLHLNTATLSFPTERGPTYVVEYKLKLTDALWRELTSVAGAGAAVTITDDGLTDTAKFYRIHVR